MIRQHIALEGLSADAAPMSLLDKIPEDAHWAVPTGQVETYSVGIGGQVAKPGHALNYYLEPLSTVILLVASITAMLAWFKVRREAAELRQVRDRYRAFFRDPHSGPAEYQAGVHTLAGIQ